MTTVEEISMGWCTQISSIFPLLCSRMAPKFTARSGQEGGRNLSYTSRNQSLGMSCPCLPTALFIFLQLSDHVNQADVKAIFVYSYSLDGQWDLICGSPLHSLPQFCHYKNVTYSQDTAILKWSFSPHTYDLREAQDTQKRSRTAKRRLADQPYEFEKLTQAITQLRHVSAHTIPNCLCFSCFLSWSTHAQFQTQKNLLSSWTAYVQAICKRFDVRCPTVHAPIFAQAIARSSHIYIYMYV